MDHAADPNQPAAADDTNKPSPGPSNTQQPATTPTPPPAVPPSPTAATPTPPPVVPPPQPVSAAQRLQVQVGNVAAEVVAADMVNRRVTLSAPATWQTYDRVARVDAPRRLRGGSRATDHDIVATDLNYLAQVRAARDTLKRAGVGPTEILDGTEVYDAHIPSDVNGVLSANNEFARALRAGDQQFVRGTIGIYYGLRFIENNNLPRRAADGNNGLQTALADCVVCGSGAAVELYQPEDGLVQPGIAGEYAPLVSGNAVKVPLDALGVLWLIFTMPDDPLGRTIRATWAANCAWVAPSDSRFPGAARHKRAITITVPVETV